MPIHFTKYHGTANDFIMIDNRSELFDQSDSKLISLLCDRRFGIGADGLILLEEHPSADFKMVYFNADGNPSSMCGNGGRCIVHFAHQLGLIGEQTNFMAVDGLHTATLFNGIVSLQMSDVTEIKKEQEAVFLDTGSPHHVSLVPDVDQIDVKKEGARLRYDVYGPEGANINFVQAITSNHYKVRTYERGVEDETYSCGTGVTAVAIAMHFLGHTTDSQVQLQTPGGALRVSFSKTGDSYSKVVLTGPAKAVYNGVWE